METRQVSQKKIITFLLLTFALSSLFYGLMIVAGSYRAQGGLYLLGLMWCPGIAAMSTQWLFQRNIRGLGWSLGRRRYLWTSYALPLLYGLVTYSIVWITGLGRFSPQQVADAIAPQIGYTPQSPYAFAVVYFIIAVTLGLLPSCVTALGEEIGWRGLLVPQLAKVTSFSKTALISGVIWAVWHYPILLFADYNNRTPAWYGLACFTVMVLGMSFAFAWLRLKSGSLWTAVLLHASHNLVIKNVFTLATADMGITPYIVDEFGIALALAALVVAYVAWKKRSEIPAAPSLA